MGYIKIEYTFQIISNMSLEKLLEEFNSNLLDIKNELKEMNGQISELEKKNVNLDELNLKMDAIALSFGVHGVINNDTKAKEKYTVPNAKTTKSDKVNYPAYLKNVQSFTKYYYLNHRDMLISNFIFTDDDEKQVMIDHKSAIAKKKSEDDKKLLIGGKIYIDIIKNNAELKKRLTTMKTNERRRFVETSTQILEEDEGKGK